MSLSSRHSPLSLPAPALAVTSPLGWVESSGSVDLKSRCLSLWTAASLLGLFYMAASLNQPGHPGHPEWLPRSVL